MPRLPSWLLVAAPLAEIALFIQIGGRIGVWPTLGLVIGSAVAGAAVLQRQGLALLAAARTVRSGLNADMPLHIGLAMLAGVLLIVPGLLTSAVGLALLPAPVRRALVRRYGPAPPGGAGQNAGGAGQNAGGWEDAQWREVPKPGADAAPDHTPRHPPPGT